MEEKYLLHALFYLTNKCETLITKEVMTEFY